MTHHPRYTREEMGKIWEDENRFQTMVNVEVAAAEAMAEIGIIPKDAARDISEKAGFDIQRIEEIDAEVRHDTIAFLTSVAEHIGPNGRYLHQGMTSSDALDTSLSIMLRDAADIMLKGIDGLMAALKEKAEAYKMTPCIGRSHGIHAEPTSFGLKMAGHYAVFKRHRKRLEQARDDIATCAISGAVGTFATVDPRVEAYVADKLGLTVEPVSTQIIARDRHAMYFATLAVIASSIENLATEIRHLQRTEVREAAEFFHAGQKGSSAMPHKRNPILSENLTGLARVIRSSILPALENMTLWHERDMSHSSVERFIAPQATITLDFALVRMTGIIKNLLVYPERMQENLDILQGLVFSQSVLLKLTQVGVAREDAYRMVQRNAMKVWDGEGAFIDMLRADEEVMGYIDPDELKQIFNQEHVLRNVSQTVDRAVAG
ncbi:MAG: adenylosuccinate lyase [Pseudomonadota bacterium]